MNRSACDSLSSRFASGDLSCIGPKHFPPELWKGEKGIAAEIALEIGAGARAGIQRIIAGLREIRNDFPAFELDAAADRFLALHTQAQTDVSLPDAFRRLIAHFLTKEGGVARPKKGPQLDNTIAFFEEVLRKLPSPRPK